MDVLMNPALAAILGGLLSGVPALICRWWTKPCLKIDYRCDAGNKTASDYTDEHGKKHSNVYERIRITNTGKRPAKGCRVFLTKIQKQVGTGRAETQFHDARQLAWAGYNFEGQDIPNGVHFYADIIRISKFPGQEGWNFPANQAFSSDPEIRNFRGTYVLTILVTAENADPVSIALNATYNGDWHSLAVVPDVSTKL